VPEAHVRAARLERARRARRGPAAPGYTTPSSRPAFAKASIAVPSWSSVSAAFMIVRILALSFATIG